MGTVTGLTVGAGRKARETDCVTSEKGALGIVAMATTVEVLMQNTDSPWVHLGPLKSVCERFCSGKETVSHWIGCELRDSESRIHSSLALSGYSHHRHQRLCKTRTVF